MKKICGVLLAVAVLGGGAAGVMSGKQTGTEVKSPGSTVTTAPETESGKAPEDMLGLAIKGISLFQGESGLELWRLKASWAHITEEGGVIDVDSPVVRYTLGDPALEDYMDVAAQKGRITDNQRHLALWGDVVVTRAEQKVTGPRLDYDAATRTMVFPEGAQLDGPSASGESRLFTWNLADNVMIGEGGVSILLKAVPGEEEPAVPKGADAVEENSASDGTA